MKRALALFGVAVAAANAHAAFIGDVVGFAGGAGEPLSSLTVAPGETISGAVFLDASLGTRCDFALFKLEFSVAGLEHAPRWFQWSSPFTTGGLDDFSAPNSTSGGVINPDSYVDLLEPDAVDLKFENLTDEFGQYFEGGIILTFGLLVPSGFEPGDVTISFIPDSFADGVQPIAALAGMPLTLTVVPSPAATAAGLLACSALVRRRRTK